MQHALAFARRHREAFLKSLQDFVRFPSISSQPEHAVDIRRCASWLAAHLKKIGLDRVEIVSTKRHPLVYAEWRGAPRRPTIFVYGHYDVQPVDPFGEWKSPPFAATVRNQKLYGRGASDDKGQLFCHIKAIEAWLKTRGSLPVNVRCLFEGEEEIGSPNFRAFLERNRRSLGSASIAVISDTRMLGPNRPAITHALRGGLSLELEVHGPKRDVHSGNFGGAILNPLQSLCEILAALHDRNGCVTVPGFYDDVRQWSKQERSYMAKSGPSNVEILSSAQVDHGWGERGYSLYERTTIRPALTMNGLTAGYQGLGGKGIIPAKASAKLNFRLVPDQDPVEIDRLFRDYIRELTPPAVTSIVRTNIMSKATLVSRWHPAMEAAAKAYRESFGTEAVFIRSGGTIPVVNLLQDILSIPTVLMGFALPDDGMHAPNEKFHLTNFYKGIETSIRFLATLGGEA